MVEHRRQAMSTTNFNAALAAANKVLNNGFRNKVVNGVKNADPRFELYHAGTSLCSYKVRVVLAEKNISYVSHDMMLPGVGLGVPENYHPSYLRLRMLGAANDQLVSGYTGGSSVSTEGFDPCVVPTLVDKQVQKVIVDSSAICYYIDSTVENTRLIPPDMAADIKTQTDIVDRTPHVALFYGATPNKDHRPELIKFVTKGIHLKKVKFLERMMASVQNEPALVAAYKAKIAKEKGGGQFVKNDTCMETALQIMVADIEQLEQGLTASNGAWLCGEQYTLADIMWTISLYRMRWLGLESLWTEGRRPQVGKYTQRAYKRPSFKAAVLDWPLGMPPSKHIAESNTFGAWLRAGAQALRTLTG